MRRLEHEAPAMIADRRRSADIAAQRALAYVTPEHFAGIDRNPFAVEVAKVTMMLAKKLAADELGDDQQVLPLDNLDRVITAGDVLAAARSLFARKLLARAMALYAVVQSACAVASSAFIVPNVTALPSCPRCQ